MPDADLLIAGGGPAGLAAALHARRAGLSVIVVEPRPTPIDKACGEGLMPGGLAALADLGVDPAGEPFRGIAYVDGRRRAEALFRHGPGRGVRRTELQSALALAAAAAGAQWTVGRVDSVTQDSDGVSAFGLRGRWLIAADGLHSPIRRGLGVKAVAGRPRRFGLRRHYRIAPWSDFVEVWWSPRGEAYVTPVAPDLVGVAVLSSEKPDLAWFPGLASLLGDATAGPERGAGPLRQVVSQRVVGRVLLVGDAGGYEDALTGEGISLAVKQAGAAVAAIVAGDPARYERDWRRITRDYRLLTRGLVLATALRPMRRVIVPVSAAAPRLFGSIVNILAR